MNNALKSLVKSEAFPGVLLLIATILALIVRNSPLSTIYIDFLNSELIIGFRGHDLAKPLLLWVNDGLMVIFFFVIGLELKREVREGELSNKSQILLPTVAALGGVIMPAVIFVAFNQGDSFALRGWAIPTATDIAFAVGVLVLLGKRVNSSLKLFLLTLAVIDDICAILIIALFYTEQLSFISIFIAGILLFVLWYLHKLRVGIKSIYIIITILLWLSVLNSGVHATIAGVLAAFFIPTVDKDGNRMLDQLDDDLHGVTNYFILPVFAFVNAGVLLHGIEFSSLINNVSMGIFFGLLVGKQLGVFLFSFIFIKLGFAKLPKNSTWSQLYGVCILTGIGFTMSLFVNSLAYHDSDVFVHSDKLAILVGSLASGIIGYLYLLLYSKVKRKKE
nr:Na+/H+ antiporter NhaA [Campylobacter sp.]